MIDLRKPYSWENINEQIKEQMAVSCAVRFYQSLSQALLETSLCFQNLYSHKRQFYFHLGLGTHADEAILSLSRQGIKASDALTETNFDEKKTLFCLLDLDDAVTAEVYKRPEAIDEKIFKISISHHQHLFEKQVPQPKETEILILSFGCLGAVGLFGKRCATLPGVVASTLLWPAQAPKIFPWPIKSENQQWVQKVESENWGDGRALLEKSSQRRWDRALLYWTDLEGEALRQLLIKDNGIDQNHLEALSLSRWNEIKLISQFEKRGWSPEIFRGALVISTALAENTAFKKQLESAVQKLRSNSRF